MDANQQFQVPSPASLAVRLLEITPPSLLQVPDWRWQRGLLNSPLEGDSWSERASAWIAGQPEGAGICSSSQITASDPVISAACEIQTDVFRRAELEARVLTQQSPEAIAGRMGLDLPVVEAFEALFFDVRHDLHRDLWVLTRVVKLMPGDVLQTGDALKLWRLFGWRHGPLVVDLLVRSVDREQLACRGLDAYLEPELDLPLALKQSIVGEQIPVPETVVEQRWLLRLQDLHAGVERLTGQATALGALLSTRLPFVSADATGMLLSAFQDVVLRAA